MRQISSFFSIQNPAREAHSGCSGVGSAPTARGMPAAKEIPGYAYGKASKQVAS